MKSLMAIEVCPSCVEVSFPIAMDDYSTNHHRTIRANQSAYSLGKWSGDSLALKCVLAIYESVLLQRRVLAQCVLDIQYLQAYVVCDFGCGRNGRAYVHCSGGFPMPTSPNNWRSESSICLLGGRHGAALTRRPSRRTSGGLWRRSAFRDRFGRVPNVRSHDRICSVTTAVAFSTASVLDS
jgi:hypothetical protein